MRNQERVLGARLVEVIQKTQKEMRNQERVPGEWLVEILRSQGVGCEI